MFKNAENAAPAQLRACITMSISPAVLHPYGYNFSYIYLSTFSAQYFFQHINNLRPLSLGSLDVGYEVLYQSLGFVACQYLFVYLFDSMDDGRMVLAAEKRRDARQGHANQLPA